MGQALFQSTRPVWGATVDGGGVMSLDVISIHAPRVGRDVYADSKTDRVSNFNPRAPCGARREFLPKLPVRLLISIHAPRVGRDANMLILSQTKDIISIHAPRVGRDYWQRKLCRLAE